MNKDFLSTSFNSLISQLWDRNVIIRAKDLESGSDYTYNQVIRPWVLEQLKINTKSTDAVLDIGSGCGFLTNAVYNSGWNDVVGIDISKRSIEYSQKKYPQIKFIHQDIYKMQLRNQFNVCIAVMAVNNMPNADIFFAKVNECLDIDGKLILILPHPCFWPIKHIDDPQFRYDMEAGYCKRFNTKGRCDYKSNVLFYHRPIEQYLSLLRTHSFEVTTFTEIKESEHDKFPDILGIIATKQ